jgi:hypothetical protein
MLLAAVLLLPELLAAPPGKGGKRENQLEDVLVVAR